MNNLDISILGLPVVNPDLEVEIIDPARPDRPIETGKPFRDGTVKFRKLDPGLYDVVIRHPNLLLPVTRRPIRILPTGETKVSILIDPAKFKNTPIADVPDANLQPVIEQTQAVETDVHGLGNKQGGEAILAADWNTLAGGVETLAQNVAELARLAAPIGHNHPEYEAKLNELSTNFETLLNTLSASMAEIQRRLQIERLESRAKDLLDTVEGTEAVRTARRRVSEIIASLEEKVTDPPLTFSDLLRTASDNIQRIVNEATAGGGEPQVKDKFDQFTTELAVLQPARDYTSELIKYQRVNRRFAGINRRNIEP